jgi:alpha-L-rhamnosidase
VTVLPDGAVVPLVDGSAAPSDQSTVEVTALVCEYLTNPMGVDVMQPRLSWALESTERGQKQTAYQIVATTDQDTIWDSGKVVSDRQLHIPYAGKALVSGQRVTWKVKIWDASDRESAWSDPAFWEMGMLNAADWKGQWIGATDKLVTPSAPAPYLRKTFSVTKPVRSARAYIAGVGYSELYLNGQKVSDHVLDPGYTRFDRRIIYVTHDVTQALQQGNNALGIILGNGWLNVNAADTWDFDTAPWRMTPRALAQLVVSYTDGTSETLATDLTWKVSTGAIVFDGIRNGQSDDARLEKPGWSTATYAEDASWTAAVALPSPGGVLSAQMFPPQKVVQTLPAKKMTEVQQGVFVFDFGQNIAGWAQLSVTGAAGTKVTMKYGEVLATDGTVDQTNVAGIGSIKFYKPPVQTDTYTLRGSGAETFEPRFAYYGFQYVEVSGFPGRPTLDSLHARVVHTAFDTIGSFSSSNDLLNRIQTATQWSYKANFQSIPTDCPHREKNGWMGDAHMAGELAMLNFANGAAYTKWLRDIRDEMRPTGELPGIVPTSGWGYTNYSGPAWGSALLLLPWYLYEYSGDEQILTTSYDHFKRYVDYVTSKNYLAANPSGWLGDCVMPGETTPEGVTHAGYHATDARIVAKTAELLGKADDVQKYNALADKVKQDFLAKYFDAGTAQVAGDSQTALAAALYQGLLDDADRPRVLARLVAKIGAKNDHLDTGCLGTKYLPWVLTEGGRADLFYKIATQTDFPSWGRWMNQGATTLWETWKDEGSHNHIFLGDISAWFFRALGGINPDPEGPGFAKIIIRPEVVGDLTFAKAETRTLRGMVHSDWKIDGASLVLSIVIPVNSTATVYVPAASQDAVTAEGATFVRSEGGRQVFSVGSGAYTFTAKR